LEREPSNETEIVHSALKTSGELKQKIKDYFDELEMTMENMDEIYLIISSISKIETLNYINKYEYLEKSLLNMYSSDHFIKWSQCFLTKSQLEDDIERARYKKLFQSWSDCLTNTYANFLHVLRAMDEILNSFDQSDDQNWARLYFINSIIDLCFQQGTLLKFIFNYSDFLPFRQLFSDDRDRGRSSSREERAISYTISR
jgi:hypothetical protein